MSIFSRKPVISKKLKTFALCLLPLAVAVSSCKKDPVEPDDSKTSNEFTLKDITKNTTLEDRVPDANVPDYFVNGTIAIAAELTIKPGVVIAFSQGARMDVNDNGSIVAVGEADKKIRFTGKVPQKGYWSGIMMYSISTKNIFSHVEIMYAGSSDMLDGQKAALSMFDEAKLQMNNTLISYTDGNGMYLRDGAIIRNFSNNHFANNNEAPMMITARNIPALDSATRFSDNNGINKIAVATSFFTGTGEIVWPAFSDQTPYLLVGDVNAEANWKLMPGVIIEAKENVSITSSEGYFNAVGTPDKKIIIRGAEQTAGTWKGIVIYTKSANNRMENVVVSHAGSSEIFGSEKAGVSLFGSTNANMTLKNCLINYSGGYGIHVYGAGASVNSDVETVNTFANNASASLLYNE